jgi:hypothetical protein
MNVGKTRFAEVMEFVPSRTFGRPIIERHKAKLTKTGVERRLLQFVCQELQDEYNIILTTLKTSGNILSYFPRVH